MTSDRPIRRGLPRVAGGPGWPDVAGAVTAAPLPSVAAAVAVPDAAVAAAVAEAAPLAAVEVQVASAPTATASADPDGLARVEVPLRRGLPRSEGGAPWPAEGTALVAAKPERAVRPAAEAVVEAVAEPVAVVEQPAAVRPAASAAAPAPASPASAAPKLYRGRTIAQWTRLAVLGFVGAVLAAGVIVLAARGVTTLPGVPEFVERYPGEYPLPDFAVAGFPLWANWTHFLNLFMMALIIRTGLQVRTQKRPPAYVTPRRGGQKVSLALWLHTAVDVLWLANGLVFVVLLFVSGHWVRIVPTSWEVIPNAASALLQYLTLEWPHENGWVNYNSLQQLAYFGVVFVLAPVSAITGFRMSRWWPERSATLNRMLPAKLARAVHFPAMLAFVLFIIVHVFLVLTTGALRNLNHMFAGSDATGWAGFAWFVAGIVVTGLVVWAAKPIVVAPVARLFGTVSER